MYPTVMHKICLSSIVAQSDFAKLFLSFRYIFFIHHTFQILKYYGQDDISEQGEARSL